MKSELFYRKTSLFAIFITAGLILLYAAPAAAVIGKITGFKGEAIVQSGAVITKVAKAGMPLNSGDTIATQNGEVNVTFTDGAVMKVNPYGNIVIQERQEESGFWVFKQTYTARRITCMVGKIWFKSGASNTRNFLQTPTAVVRLKGSDGDVGFDNLRTYLNMYSGDAAVIGNVIRGAFENPGLSAASRNAIYQALQTAYQQTVQAQAAPANVLKPVVQEQARLAALQVVLQVATVMKSNPDATVATQATQALTAVNTAIVETRAALTRDTTLAQQAGVTVPATTTTTLALTTVPVTAAATTAASTTSTSTTSTTSTTSSISTTTICPSPPCEPKK